jgi:hypothetical protein
MGSFLYFFDQATMNNSVFWVVVLFVVLGFVTVALISESTRKCSATQTDAEKLEQLLGDIGYSFDRRQNIFYARMDAWQRKYGYCQLYDEATAPLSMIIDCEPIRFEYANKKWLIELWKGQYGLTTGCEVGVYTTDGPDLNIPNVFSGTFYQCASDEDCLPMSVALRKNNRYLFQRRAKHWWLTGFILGEFSEPSELIMDVDITLKDNEMRKAFISGLYQVGYSKREIRVVNNTVRLSYSRPHSAQPHSRTEWISTISQRKNKLLCQQYQIIAKDSRNMYQIIKNIEHKSPELYGLIIHMGRSEKLFKAYEAITYHKKELP